MMHSHRSPNSTNWEKKRSDTMAKPPHGGEMGGFYLFFWLRNYRQHRGTRPGTWYSRHGVLAIVLVAQPYSAAPSYPLVSPSLAWPGASKSLWLLLFFIPRPTRTSEHRRWHGFCFPYGGGG